jgi:hypothetical protein
MKRNVRYQGTIIRVRETQIPPTIGARYGSLAEESPLAPNPKRGIPPFRRPFECPLRVYSVEKLKMPSTARFGQILKQ